jgi:mRNA interferase MazF
MLIPVPKYTPYFGEIIRINFEPQLGREINKRRYGLVVSRSDFNKTGLAIVCPITGTVHGEPFEVPVPKTQYIPVHGVILCNQFKSMDWTARKAEYVCKVQKSTLAEVIGKIKAILK